MAKRKFDPIIIDSLATLSVLRSHIRSWYGTPKASEINALRRDLEPNRRALTEYFSGIGICLRGFNTVLKEVEAGQIKTWPQYIRKHWVNTEARHWFMSRSSHLTGRHISYWDNGNGADHFIARVRQRNGKWIPFPKKAKQ